MARSIGRGGVSRRRFLSGAAAASVLATAPVLAAPLVSYAGSRPRITHGVQSGDASLESGMVWSRCDRPARMLVETATSERFRDAGLVARADALPETDFTAKILLDELPAGTEIFYRITFEDLGSPAIRSEPLFGRFRTAPADRRDVSFIWSGDSMGQGWGIDPGRGGMRTYATMLRHRPDFFVHCGDMIYADCPVEREVVLPDETLWRNIVTAEKSKVAETLDEFRGNYKYNLLDLNLLAFNAEVPLLAQWDDHEVTDDWFPGQTLLRDEYGERSAGLLAARGARAFREYVPIREVAAEPGRVYRKIAYGPLLDVFLLDMRSYRGANSANNGREYGPAAHFLGPRQVAWLKRELSRSTATWKVIAADMPIGLVSFDGVAQGDGAPAGRELEIADILAFLRRAGIRNTVWITADVHYTAAHHYSPDRAMFQDFLPFWEFVSGPLHAGTGNAGDLDNTFGPRVIYQNACPREQGEYLAPCFGLQFFGHVRIEGATGVMTITLRDVADAALFQVQLEPLPA